MCYGIYIGITGEEIYINAINCVSSLEDVRQLFFNLLDNVN